MLLPEGVTALATYNGGQVTIDRPIQDDVFATGGTVNIDAPITSLIVAGGMVNVNAPVAGDVIAAGGTITINGDVVGKLVAAGGTVIVNGRIGTNAVITGGTVEVGKGATINRDALISGGTVTNGGLVVGNLTVRAQSFTNTGSAGHLDVQLNEPRGEFSRIFSIFGILFTIGMLILGLVLLKLVPKGFIGIEEEVRTSAILKTIAGFFAIIISFIILILISITVILLPLALVFWMIFFIALLLSTLFVSLAFGRIIVRWVKWEAQLWQMFVLGFIILNLIFRIPIIGIIVLVISVSLGFAAFSHGIYVHWNTLRGETTIT